MVPTEKKTRRLRQGYQPTGADDALVGASLPREYLRKISVLHAATGLTKKQLLQEALDNLFTSRAADFAHALDDTQPARQQEKKPI